MKVYQERPTQRRARRAWDHFQARHPGKRLARLWKNPSCFGGPRLVGNMWGWWVCEFDDGTTDFQEPKAI